MYFCFFAVVAYVVVGGSVGTGTSAIEFCNCSYVIFVVVRLSFEYCVFLYVDVCAKWEEKSINFTKFESLLVKMLKKFKEEDGGVYIKDV